ncbi:hypothetical protein RFI_31172 [Reticulomyxa filosa]|uniref:Uncharacterized protein n=1 Tax=Reticulomyxa filosa TaxID=46433 RepID=X6LZQ4_RETFI|nr:hypothetical protein RFI_31172 [Reticulomyxa filosa]|eukprot:ETO06225.1 hypothetical protein RFI_31172 [Reticulomyxa filosa]
MSTKTNMTRTRKTKMMKNKLLGGINLFLANLGEWLRETIYSSLDILKQNNYYKLLDGSIKKNLFKLFAKSYDNLFVGTECISLIVEVWERKDTVNRDKDKQNKMMRKQMYKSNGMSTDYLIVIRKKINIFWRKHSNKTTSIMAMTWTLITWVSASVEMLLFEEILDCNNKNYLCFYYFKQAFTINVNASIILRKYVKDYYEKVAEYHRRKLNKTLETSLNLFVSKVWALNKSQFKEGM